jgi:hypothetical protein
MREELLGKVLLVKAVEEADGTGELLPLADREHATRTVLRASDGHAGELPPDARAARLLHVLGERAGLLFVPLSARYPVLTEMLERSRYPSWATPLLLALAFASGVALASTGGSRHIDILAFPFLGVIAWNLAVYLAIAVLAVRRRAGGSPALAPPQWTGKAIARRLAGTVGRTAKVHARLGEVAGRYAADWAVVGAPLFAAHVRRLMHLGAATIAAGLIVGLYLRGIVFRYEAGWESTFLGPRAVRAIVNLVFGPASSLTGIALPSSDADVAQLRWTADGGGGDAAPWIHLAAVTLVLYVVVPRLGLALVSWLDAWRWRRASALPAALIGFARSTLGAAQFGPGGGRVIVVPYAHEVTERVRTAINGWLDGEFGRGAQADLQPMVHYGDEAAVRATLDAASAGEVVLLVSLASTPENENHGLALAAARDAAREAQPPRELRVVVDEAPYQSRLAPDASLAGRLEERRRLWREFVRGYGMEARFVDLRSA